MSTQLGAVGEEYGLKRDDNSSHALILRWLEQIPPSRLLDLGCSSGLLSEAARRQGHAVTSVDVVELPGIADRVDRFIQADLDAGLPPDVVAEGPFEVVLAADVLEHVRRPRELLNDIRQVLIPRGTLIASVPNFGHWYARSRVALGIFDYDQRGVLDAGHVRFYMRRGFLRRLSDAGFDVVRCAPSGLPVEVLTHSERLTVRLIRQLDATAVAVWPTLFGYQFVVQCERPPEPTILKSTGVAAAVAS
jgi:SAM-dependent methyltransferase